MLHFWKMNTMGRKMEKNVPLTNAKKHTGFVPVYVMLGIPSLLPSVMS